MDELRFQGIINLVPIQIVVNVVRKLFYSLLQFIVATLRPFDENSTKKIGDTVQDGIVFANLADSTDF